MTRYKNQFTKLHTSTQFSQEWARRKVVVKHSIKSKIKTKLHTTFVCWLHSDTFFKNVATLAIHTCFLEWLRTQPCITYLYVDCWSFPQCVLVLSCSVLTTPCKALCQMVSVSVSSEVKEPCWYLHCYLHMYKEGFTSTGVTSGPGSPWTDQVRVLRPQPQGVGSMLGWSLGWRSVGTLGCWLGIERTDGGSFVWFGQ